MLGCVYLTLLPLEKWSEKWLCHHHSVFISKSTFFQKTPFTACGPGQIFFNFSKREVIQIALRFFKWHGGLWPTRMSNTCRSLANIMACLCSEYTNIRHLFYSAQTCGHVWQSDSWAQNSNCWSGITTFNMGCHNFFLCEQKTTVLLCTQLRSGHHRTGRFIFIFNLNRSFELTEAVDDIWFGPTGFVTLWILCFLYLLFQVSTREKANYRNFVKGEAHPENSIYMWLSSKPTNQSFLLPVGLVRN